MKSTRLTLCCAALLSAFCLTALAADEVVPAKKRTPVVRGAKPAVSSPESVAETRSRETRYAEESGQFVYQVLLAEIALQRGDVVLASNAYADLALRTRDPKVLERTVTVTSIARRFDLALDAARLWVDAEPESKKAQQVLASVMVLSNQLDDLAPNLIRMLEVDKAALTDNLLGLNRMLARNPDRQAVFQLIEKVCRPFFGIAEAHYAMAMAAGSAGVNDRALAEVRRALVLRPDWEMAALLQAQLMARGSPADTVNFLQEFVGNNPNARDARLHLARLLVTEKRYADARKHFELLLETFPNNPDVVFPVAILALQQNDRVLAEAQFKHFLSLPVIDKNYAYFYLGEIAEDAKRIDEALAYYAQVSGGEQYLPAQIRRARLLVDQGKPDEARKQLSLAKGGSAEDKIQLAIAHAALLRDAKRPQEAFDQLEPLLAKQPEQTDLLYETALLAEKIGRLDVMESRLRKLINLRPDSAQAYNALGYSLADRKLRLPEARELIEKALTLSPEDYFILDSMGWVLFRQGDLSGALDYLERALVKRDDPEIAAHIGEVLWALGRKEDAQRVLNEAKKKFPDNEMLIEAVKKFVP
ncbi:MAG: tetratricopeptide repeat protein [Betaproteobacteria bacterium]